MIVYFIALFLYFLKNVALSSPRSTFLSAVAVEGGISADRLSATLHITKSELAVVAGLPRDAMSTYDRSGRVAIQSRLREMSEIFDRVIPWAGSVLAAYAWYRSQSLRSFGDPTAEELVRLGHGEKVRAYLARIAVGGFA